MNENFRLSDLFLNVEEEEKETWKIENDNTADWALDKIKEAREEYERFERVASNKINEIQSALEKERKKMESETSFFEAKLREYIETVKMKETKTQKTYSLPAGKIIIKKDKQDFKIDKEKVIESIKNLDGYEEYIKIKEDIAWSDLKKNLFINEGCIINKTTGEVLEVEGLYVDIKPGKFEIKF
ncbi:host-nuclease inhibitor Gam family protein [Tepidibacter aestuarii]|uniref:host-nuclease inhibitor Gam family protein n=1 Tax=Tepidibacter aestuarii TaxID=2925782 RepID=UPI0020C12A80|nr:host-nuclease inhibitor Gam family protein [Tepidibacter aestuarii]CAH2212982.1 protein of unknown function [Tepidibacter aestuarii]